MDDVSKRRLTLSDDGGQHSMELHVVVQAAIDYSKSELQHCCENAKFHITPTKKHSAQRTDCQKSNDGRDAGLENPIPEKASASQVLSAVDIAKGQNLWDWLISTLPTKAQDVIGVTYSFGDLRQKLLKCYVRLEAMEMHPKLLHLTLSCYEELKTSGGAVAKRDVLKCFANAFTALFLYTVNLDGHYVDSNKLLSVKDSLDLIGSYEWPVQKGDRSCPKSSPVQKVKVPRTTNSPLYPEAHGKNPAIWGVTNWSKRVAADPNAKEKVRVQAQEAVDLFSVFTQYLNWALSLLPSKRQTCFRGIRARVGRKYKTPTALVSWPGFTSLSTEHSPALDFVGNSAGSMIVVQCAKAVDLSFLSWFPNQAEMLLSAGSTLRVLSRIGDTVQTMLGSNLEVIVMRENDDNADNSTILQQAMDVVGNTVFVFEPFLKHCINSRFSLTPTGKNYKDVVAMCDILAKQPVCENERRWIIVGRGGSGKTSAMLFLMHRLAKKFSPTVLPVCVPLPALLIHNRGEEADVTSIQDFVLASLGLETTDQLQTVASRRNVVLLLDSLDEVPQEQRERLHSDISMNQILKDCQLILFTRPAAFEDAQKMMNDSPHTILHCQPFHPMEIRQLVYFESKDPRYIWNQFDERSMFPLLSNPLMLSMCLDVAKKNKELLFSSWTVDEKTVLGSLMEMDDSVIEAADVANSLHRDAYAIADVGRTKVKDARRYLRYESTDPSAPVSFRSAQLQAYVSARQACVHLSSADVRAGLLPGLKNLSSNADCTRWCASLVQQHNNLFGRVTKHLVKFVEATKQHKENEALIGTALGILTKTGLPLAQFFNKTDALTHITIQNAHLDGACFANVNLTGTTFKNCVLTNCDFNNATVNDAVFKGNTFGELPPLKMNGSRSTFSFSRDGEIIACASRDGITTLHRTASGECLFTFQHGHLVERVTFSRDGTVVASGGRGRVTIFDTTNVTIIQERCTFTYGNHDATVEMHALGISTKKDFVVIATDCDVLVSSIHPPAPTSRFKLRGNVCCGSFSMDTNLYVCGRADGTVSLYKINETTCVEQWCCITVEMRVSFVDLSADGKAVISARSDGTVFLHNSEKRSIICQQMSITSLTVSQDGMLFAVGGRDSSITVYQRSTGAELCSFMRGGTVRCLAFSPDKRLVASGIDAQDRQDFAVRIHLVGVSAKTTFPGHTNGDAICCVAISPNQRYIGTSSTDGARVHELATGNQLLHIRNSDVSPLGVTSLIFSPDSETIACGHGSGAVQTMHFCHGTQVTSHYDHARPIKSIGFSLDGKFLASICAEGSLKVLDLMKGTTRTGTVAGEPISLGFTNRGHVVVSCQQEGTYVLHEYLSEKPKLHQHAKDLWCGDGFASVFGTICVYSHNGQSFPTLAEKHSDPPLGTLSANGKCFALRSRISRVVRFFKKEKDETWKETEFHCRAHVNCLAISTRGNILVCGCAGGIVHTFRTQESNHWHFSRIRLSNFFGSVGTISESKSDDSACMLFRKHDTKKLN